MKHPRPASLRSVSTGTRVWIAALFVAAGLVTAARPAAEPPRCFGDDPATHVCIEGRFLDFWLQHGGEVVFGAPVAPTKLELTPDGPFPVQYFERARMELHLENVAPYDVQLGRIGVERLVALGRGDEMASTTGAEPECQRFDATGHNLCGRFLDYWRTHGLNLDEQAPVSEAESIGLLGLPITEAFTETAANGLTLRTQWFERARLVEFSDGIVAATALGREVAEAPALAAPPAQAPSPTAAPVTAPTAAPVSAPTLVLVPPPAPVPVVEPAPNVAAPRTPCDGNVPRPANDLQLWVANLGMNPPEDQAVACVRLIVDGEAARGASAIIYRHYGDQVRTTIAQTTGAEGVAGFIFYTGDGSPGMPTHLEAIVTYRGVPYRTTLWLP